MSNGLAPSLMLDLATTEIRDRQRTLRERTQTGVARRARQVRRAARR